MDRIRALQRNLNHQTMRGIEIGPWFKPVVPKRVWDVAVVDFTDTDGLREIARTHNDRNIREAVDMVETVDVVWNGQALDEACLRLSPQGYDFLIASHVFEHLPDLVTILQQVGRLLKPEGYLTLALPDLRFTFDFFRNVTTTADVLLAHRQKRTRHTPENLFMAESTNCWNQGMAMWPRQSEVSLHVVSLLKPAYDIYLRELANLGDPETPYVDSHAWVFTPSSFRLLIVELHHLGLIPFQVLHIEDGELGEFIVQLGKSGPELAENDVHTLRRQLMIATVRELAERAARLKD